MAVWFSLGAVIFGGGLSLACPGFPCVLGVVCPCIWTRTSPFFTAILVLKVHFYERGAQSGWNFPLVFLCK